MSTAQFSVGDLVWAKMKSYPPWPARIVDPPEEVKSLPRSKIGHRCCCFLESQSYAWIKEDQIFKHSAAMLPNNLKGKSAQFRKAVEMIFQLSSDAEDENTEERSEDNNAEMQPSISSSASKHMSSEDNVQKSKKERELKFDSPKKKSPKKLEFHTRNAESGKVAARKKETHSKLRGLRVKFSKKRAIDDEIWDNEDEDESSPLMSKNVLDKTRFHVIPSYNQSIIPKRPKLSPYVERPSTPIFDMNSDIEEIKDRKIQPSQKKFGFLGLGFIGRILAKRILFSGHSLIIWNRSPEKCDDFIKAGAISLQTPADVVARADITFCCFSDTEAVKSIVFDNCGVLKGMDTNSGKGFCVLNTIGPFDSRDINEAIVKKGGMYLEAFVHGTRTMAEGGQLAVIAAGHRNVFRDCYSCFESFARDVFYDSNLVGNAAIMNVLAHTISGAACLLLSESIIYAEKNGVSLADLTNHFNRTRVSSSEICRNATAIAKKHFPTEISVKFIQQALNSAIDMSDDGTATLLTSLVNENYKKASLLRYFDHDITAIHQTME